MPLDDFFAKKDKKKIKKKKNPQALIEQLDKEVARFVEKEDLPIDASKKVNNPKDDEWEALDDDVKEVDLQTLKIGKLSMSNVEDPGKQSKDKVNPDASETACDDRKVWSGKVLETNEPPTVEQTPEPVPEEPAGALRIPSHLRQLPVAVKKPDVESSSDFPTLGATLEPEETVDSKKTDETDDGTWEQAGAPRKPTRAPDLLPVAPSQGRYIPPSMRGGSDIPIMPRSEPRVENRFRDELPRRYEAGPRRSERNAPREPPIFGDDDWSRGNTIKTSGMPFPSRTGGPNAPTNAPSRHSAFPSMSSNSGWDKGASVKTFKEGPEKKQNFELTQSNRFAGLGET